MSDSAFGDLDAAYAGTDPKAVSIGKLLPPETYCFAIVPFDAKENGQMVEFDLFKAGDTQGIRMMCEVLKPETVKDEATGEDVKTAGEVIEKVFWATVKNMGYMKNDFGQILQRDIPAGEKLSETMKSTWAGRTFQAVLANRPDKRGVMRNEISFITKWSPEEAEKAADKKTEDKPADTKKADAKKGAKSTAF